MTELCDCVVKDYIRLKIIGVRGVVYWWRIAVIVVEVGERASVSKPVDDLIVIERIFPEQTRALSNFQIDLWTRRERIKEVLLLLLQCAQPPDCVARQYWVGWADATQVHSIWMV